MSNKICTVCGGRLLNAWYIADVYSTDKVYVGTTFDRKKEMKLMACADCGLVYAKPKEECDD